MFKTLCPSCSLYTKVKDLTQVFLGAYFHHRCFFRWSYHRYPLKKLFWRRPSNYDHLYGTTASTTFVKSFSSPASTKKLKYDLGDFSAERIRNFSIVAHVDHGKSTLADRLLELTGTISSDSKNEQVLDRLQVERERGITVKAQTASLFYDYGGSTYLLNLIDTPGHVDFHYEVSRSLAACQGVILLVDANQGVQAQTLANFYLAFAADLAIIPVINKIDLKVAQPSVVLQQLHTLFDADPHDVLQISAKLGTGVTELLDAIVSKIPPPPDTRTEPLKALLFDSLFNPYRGAIVDIAVQGGVIKKGDKIKSAYTEKVYEVQELGIKYPTELPTDILYAGQVGYLTANMKGTREAHIGDTFYHPDAPVQPHTGFKPAKPMVFAGVYPIDQSEHTELRTAIEKLAMNDSSVTLHVDSSPALGQGWRIGFLGLLHMEVFNQRLEQEYDISVMVTTPNVPYKVKIHGSKNIKLHGGEVITVVNPVHLPDASIVSEYYEPTVKGTIILPDEFLSPISALCMERRGTLRDQLYIDNTRIMIHALLPLNEILTDFYDRLQTISSGYASFDYEDIEYVQSDLVKMVILINGEELQEMTSICHRSRARTIGRQVCSRLLDSIPRQLYKVAIQASVGGKVVAREDLKPVRKDVLAKCYGGDITRKMKLLRHQAEGKKRMRKIGNVDIPRDVFVKLLRR